MPKCTTCTKFTSKDTEVEPEVTQDPEINEDGSLTMTVRIVNSCAECSEELEEAEFELEGQVDVSEHTGEGHEVDLGEPEIERTDSGGTRYAKRMLGVEVKIGVTCSCGDLKAEAVMKDEIASSQMESLV